MTELGILLGIGAVAFFLGLPIFAAVTARRSLGRTRGLERMLDQLRRELAALRDEVHARPAETSPPAAAFAGAEPSLQESAAPPASAEPSPPATAPPPVSADPSPSAPASAAPSGSVEPAPSPPAAAPPSTSLEEQIALVWFTRIGALALLVGIAFFFKYAVDNDWIGPLGRVALGALCGVAILVAAELTRARTKAIYVHVLTGVGLAFLYVSAYASHAFYHLVPVPLAFGAVAVVTLLGGALAIHHRAEAVLILALAAGLLSPVLLSTGEDRPAALFGYLLVLTALDYAVAVRMKFRVALWLGVAGTTTLFVGWYAHFFDAHPPPLTPLVDRPLEELQGPYFPLAHRAAPLAAVFAFLAQWLLVFRAARRPNRARLLPLYLLCAAALLGHGGLAALLGDRPVILGGVLAVLGLGCSVLFGREGRRELLALPLLASFAVLAFTLRGERRPDTIGVLIMLGLWGAIYVRSFVADQLGSGRRPSGRTLALVGGVGVAVAVLAALQLLEPNPRGFAVVLLCLSLGYAALGLQVRSPVVLAFAGGLSFAGLLLAAPPVEVTDHRFLIVSALWAAVYLGSIGYDLVVRRVQPSALHLATFSGAGLAFAGIAALQTVEAEWLLRAAILGTLGAINLAVGLLLLSSAPRPRATLLLGQALAFFCAAFAFLFSGATLTAVWAATAAVLAWLAADAEDRNWLLGAVMVHAVAVGHLCSVDLDLERKQRLLFDGTLGREGALRLIPVWNPRALALACAAVALLLSARFVVRSKQAWFTRAAGGLMCIGHALALLLVVLETRNLLVHLPAAPGAALSADEFEVFQSAVYRALADGRGRAAMLTTLCFGSYAAALVSLGFFARDRAHRYLGLFLFSITLVKLALWDVWNLARVYQMAVLVSIGALLLGASYLYARFGRRLVALLRDGSATPTTVLVIAGALLCAGRAVAFEKHRMPERREVQGVEAPGLYRVEIDPALYQHARSAQLADLRLAGPDGNEVPYLVRAVPTAIPELLHPTTLVDPVILPDGAARAVIDLGRSGLKHSEVRLALEGGDFLRATRVEISSDEANWALLAEGARIYRVKTGGGVHGHTTIAYPTSDARYLRVTLLPSANRESVRITGAHVAYVEAGSRPLERQLPLKLEIEGKKPASRSSAFKLDAGASGVPFLALLLTIEGNAFERHAEVSATDHGAYFVGVGGGLLYRLAGAPGATLEENLRIPLRDTIKRFLRVEVRDGDNPALRVTSAAGAYRAEELVFRAAAAGPHLLYLGSEGLAAPSYNLPSVLARSGEMPQHTARFGAIGANPELGPDAAAPLPISERMRLPITLLLGVVLLGLALWTVRLLRRRPGE